MVLRSKRFRRVLGGVLAVCALQGGAQAETLEVTGVYAASVDLPAGIETVGIKSFSGDMGHAVELALTERLGAVTIHGEYYYRVFPEDALGLDSGPPDAYLRGSVNSEVSERRIEARIESDCIERDADKKCVEWEDRRIPCWEMTATLSPRIIFEDDLGQVLYKVSNPRVQTRQFCRGDEDKPTGLGLLNGMVDSLASGMRYALAPVVRTQDIRVMESRKGLAKADRKAFKTAVKLFKRDPVAACDAFRVLGRSNPAQMSVLYNVGLCYEAEGQLVAAENSYTAALNVSPGRDYPTMGLNRLASRIRAEIQLAAQNGE